MKSKSTILKVLGKNHPARRAAYRRMADEQERKANGQFGSGGSSAPNAKAAAHENNPEYSSAKKKYGEIIAKTKEASKRLDEFVSAHGGQGKMGLTPDHVKAMPEYKKLKQDVESALNAERDYGAKFSRQYKKESASERKANGRVKYE